MEKFKPVPYYFSDALMSIAEERDIPLYMANASGTKVYQGIKNSAHHLSQGYWVEETYIHWVTTPDGVTAFFFQCPLSVEDMFWEILPVEDSASKNDVLWALLNSAPLNIVRTFTEWAMNVNDDRWPNHAEAIDWLICGYHE